MLAIYEKMQKDGRIGPLVKDANGQMVQKEYEEFPKWVKRRDGASVLAKSKSEELRLIAEDPSESPPETALAITNDVLRAQNEDLRRQLQDLIAKQHNAAVPSAALPTSSEGAKGKGASQGAASGGAK